MASNLSIALMIGASVGGAMAGIKRLQSTIHTLRDNTLTTTAKLKSLGATTALGLTGTISSIKATSGIVTSIAEPAIKFESVMADVKKVSISKHLKASPIYPKIFLILLALYQ